MWVKILMVDGRNKLIAMSASIDNVRSRKIALYLVLLYDVESRASFENLFRMRQGEEWSSVAADCGGVRTGLLGEADFWFPNSTLTSCANQLFEKSMPMLDLTEYSYVVIVADPMWGENSTVKATESTLRSMETLLEYVNFLLR